MKMLAPVIVLMLDTNGDGMLSFEEVEAFHRRVFNTLDANHDGELTVEELRQGLEMWGGMGRGQH
jgi:Ca2+-binding EF-hand superfamily protein